MELSSEDEVRIVAFNRHPSPIPLSPGSPENAWSIPDSPSYTQLPQPLTKPLNHRNTKKTPQLQYLCNTLTRLSQQLHILSQRRVAERATENDSEDGPKPETCPICFENFCCPGTCATRCGHVFHRKCLDLSLDNSSACPVCRSHVHSAELIDLMSGFGEKMESKDDVVDLVNEHTTEETSDLDKALLQALKAVRESIDKSQAVDNVASKALEEKDKMEKAISSREKALEEEKSDFSKMMAAKRGELKRRSERVRSREEEFFRLETELKEKLCEVRKTESALQVKESQVEEAEKENLRVREELEQDKDTMRDKERRMMALQEAQKFRKAKEQKENSQKRILMLEQLLRHNGIAIPMEGDNAKRQRDDDRAQKPDKDAFKVDLNNDDVSVVESPVKRRKVNAPAKSVAADVFGGDLKKPGPYSRPQAPRRRGIGVQFFAPARRTVQRPAAVAKGRQQCATRR